MAVDSLLLVSRLLSYSVIMMSTCMKLPQVWKIYSAGSNKGISTRGYWLEIVSYLIAASYGFFYDYHITTYFELIILAIQSSTIVALSIIYSRQWNFENGLYSMIILVFGINAIFKMVPSIILDTLLVMNIPLSSSSKLLQINALYRMKTAGDVSLITWILAAYGCAVRLFTIVVEIFDMTILTGYTIGFILNSVIVIQILYYGDKSKKTD